MKTRFGTPTAPLCPTCGGQHQTSGRWVRQGNRIVILSGDGIAQETAMQDDPDLEAEEQFLGTPWNWLTGGSRLEIISRADWGARPPKCGKASWEKCGKAALQLPVDQVFIHHTTGSMPDTPEAERVVMTRLQNLAMNSQNKADISYNFVVMPSGRIAEGRGWNIVGYATPKNNLKSLSFCFAGNFQNNKPTLASLEGCRRILSEGLRTGRLTPTFRIRGHRDVGSTACPGRHLYAELSALDPRS
jgi:peptidoglycan recognition protein